MDVQDMFYFFGTFFFVSWFLFLAAMAVFVVMSIRWMQQTQMEIRQKAEEVETMVKDKLNQPATTVAAAMLPLLPTLVAIIRAMKKKSG